MLMKLKRAIFILSLREEFMRSGQEFFWLKFSKQVMSPIEFTIGTERMIREITENYIRKKL